MLKKVALVTAFFLVACDGAEKKPDEDDTTSKQAAAAISPPAAQYSYAGIWMRMPEKQLRSLHPSLTWFECGATDSELLALQKTIPALQGADDDLLSSYCSKERLQNQERLAWGNTSEHLPFAVSLIDGQVNGVFFSNFLIETEKFNSWLIMQTKTNGKPDASKYGGLAAYDWELRDNAQADAIASSVEGVPGLVELSYFLRYLNDEEVASKEREQARKDADEAARKAKYSEWHPISSSDEMTDTPMVALRLKAATGDPTLAARCRDQQTDFFINWGAYLGRDGPHSVTYRIDDGEKRTSIWSPSKDKTASFSANPISFMQDLMRGETLIVSVEKYDGTPITASFNVRALETASEEIRHMCDWEAEIAKLERLQAKERERQERDAQEERKRRINEAREKAEYDALVDKFRKSAANRGNVSAYNWWAKTSSTECRTPTGGEDVMCRKVIDKVYQEVKH